jgi:hypothetical protein
MILQIAKCRDIASTAGKEVLLHAEHHRACRRLQLEFLTLEEVLKPAFHRGAAQPFALRQPAPTNAIPVPYENTVPEPFARLLARQNTGKALPELTPAAVTGPFVRLQP